MKEHSAKKGGKNQTNNIEKKIESSFQSFVNSARNETDINLEKENRKKINSQRLVEEFNKFVDSANDENSNVRKKSLEKIRGEKKSGLKELKNRYDYVQVDGEPGQGIDFIIRRSSSIDSENLYARETQYDVEVRTDPELESINLSGLLMSIWDVFDRLFTECLEETGYDEVCFHATHRELEGSLSSSIYELKEENRETIIQEIMSRLTGWNQSASPGAAGKHLGISVTLLKRNLPGNGVLLAIGDDNLRRKGFSKSNFNGSIFYVDCEENCFFVSIYFGLVYNRYSELFSRALTVAEKKRLHNCVYEKLSRKGKDVEKDAKDFFLEKYNLDIEEYESGSECFLKSLAQRGLCQVSIFSDTENYRRVLMVPEKYDPLLEHVNILLTQYLAKTEPRKTVRNEREYSRHHYHGIKITCRGFTGQNMSFCVYCGTYHSYSNAFHSCKKSELLCEMCLRPVVDSQLFLKMTPTEQTNFCYTVAENLLKNCAVFCPICKKNAKSSLCFAIHERQKCREKVRCLKCTRVIKLVGKYAVQQRGKITKEHDNCEEVFCSLCNDYVDGFEDLKSPSHVCYVPTITRAKPWPSQVVCFDFETFPCDENGTMKANLVNLIYQEEPNMPQAKFKGIFFSDIPMEGVMLNKKEVKPGVEYEPDLGEELKEYYPFEILKAELGGVTECDAEKFFKKPGEGENNEMFEKNAYDPNICHLLRNPEVVDLNLFGAVKGHLDIFDLQLGERESDFENENVEEDEEDEEDEGESGACVKGKKVDWRVELLRLTEREKELVDQMRFSRIDLTEEEAREEDEAEINRKRKNTACKKNKAGHKKCKFVIDEAREADCDEEDMSEGYTEDTEARFFKNCAFEPTEPSGNVPGSKIRAKEEEIDFYVREMENEENVRKVLDKCQNAFPNFGISDDLSTRDEINESIKRFCIHEKKPDMERRKEIHKKSLGETKSNCLQQFVLYILQPRFKNAVFLGMYSSGFDNHFVFTQLIDMGVRVSPVFKGNKLITFSIPALNIRFLDFFCYVPSSLKNLEKSFNLKTGSKGFFPHILNHPRHYGLKLPHLPPKFYYEPEMMKKQDLQEFELWYEEKYDQRFDFAQEIVKYCELDVKILMAACLTFVRETLVQQSEFIGRVRQLKPNGREISFIREGGKIEKLVPNLVHVFSSGLCTLSSYVNNLFRSFYLVEKSLPIISHDVEESYSTKSSKLELEVLTYIKEGEKVGDLQFGDYRRSQRRFTIVCPESEKSRTFFVDGYSPRNKTVIEVLGCVFHGCYDCFTATNKLKNGLENYEAARLTQKRIDLLLLHPDVESVRIVRECEWKKMKKENKDVVNFFKDRKIDYTGSRRMSLKETFRGGLVEPLCVAYDAEKVSKLSEMVCKQKLSDPYGKLIDINSMYPAQLMPGYSYSNRDLDYVMCPINGHQTLRGQSMCLEECDSTCQIECRRRDGHVCKENVTCYKTCRLHHPPKDWGKLPAFALVKILPPRDQRFPILRMKLSKKEGSKNFSTLCRTCAINSTAFEGLIACQHSDKERCLFGEFTTAEIQFAIKSQGYKLVEVHEVQFYPEYDLTMFQNLLKSFYMMKVASKGFPADCKGLEEQERFLEELRETCSFGSELHLKHVENNPPRITVSKLSANALVGKLGQSQNRANKKVVTEHSQVVEIRNSKYYQLTAVKLINERSALISYKPLDDRIKPYKYGCVAIPSQVTAYSRIYLTRLAMKLESQGQVVAYCDTDSLLAFPTRESGPKLNDLCQISDRLGCLKVEKDGVTKFFSTAAKTYCLVTTNGEVTVKAKGFNLLEKLLKDNGKECLLEKNIEKVFCGINKDVEKVDSSTLVFQKQIKVHPFQMVPALVPKAKSYKLLNFIGPRRQVDLDNWLDFEFERVLAKHLWQSSIEPLLCEKPEADKLSNKAYDCMQDRRAIFCKLPDPTNEAKQYKVVLCPKIKGLLPALPYGFVTEEIDSILPFYKLVKSN